jgi:hypothetical protein
VIIQVGVEHRDKAMILRLFREEVRSYERWEYLKIIILNHIKSQI